MAQYDFYPFVEASSKIRMFEFISTGPKGEIKKIIHFKKTAVSKTVTLVFGNRRKDGSIDDITTNDNKDRNKILATVAKAVIAFSKVYPNTYIFFTGSTPARTRLYRMAININYADLNKIFDIWGLTDDHEFVPFQKNNNYIAFLIKRSKH